MASASTSWVAVRAEAHGKKLIGAQGVKVPLEYLHRAQRHVVGIRLRSK